MSWFSRQPVTRPDTIEEHGYQFPSRQTEIHPTYPDEYQGAAFDDQPMGTVVAQRQAAGEQWPGYVGVQHFKAEFTDVADVYYASQFAGINGYHENINQDIGGETSASNAHPYWDKGPVTGRASRMTGEFPKIRRGREGAYGDVKGAGPDYGWQLAQAYYIDSVSIYAEEYAKAGLVAAI